MGFFEIEPRRPLLVPTPRGVRIDASATKVGPVGPRGPQGLGSDGAVQVAMSQQAGTAMRVGVNAGTVGLLVIGDSKSAGTGLTNFADRWQNRLLGLLRARFPIADGDSMRGLIPANMSDPYNAMSGRPTTTGTTHPVDTAGLGYNTLQLELGSVLTFPAATWPAASTLPIGYHTHSGANGTLQVLVDGVVQTEINCAGAGEGIPMRTSIPIAAGTHTVSMRPKAGTAPVRPMYIEQRSAATGWHLYDAARPGLAARHVVAGPPGAPAGSASFAKAVADLPSVRLAVVALGANDMTISDPAQYGSDVRAVVGMVKAGHPTAGVVVVLPAALTDDSAVVDDVQAYHTAARSALDGVPDLSVVAETQLVDLTGPNAGSWLADSVHPNAFGHDLISRALAGSLIGLDGPTDALSLVEDAIAPAVADAQAAQTSAAQSATDADASRVLAEQAQAAALEIPDANTAAMIGNPATDTNAALRARDPYVSVKDHGATGDGTTDDTAAVQAAVAHAISTKRRLFFPAGTYLTDQIVVSGADGFVMDMEGRLRRKNSSARTNLLLLLNLTRARIGTIRTDGNVANNGHVQSDSNTYPVDEVKHDVRLQGCTDLEIAAIDSINPAGDAVYLAGTAAGSTPCTRVKIGHVSAVADTPSGRNAVSIIGGDTIQIGTVTSTRVGCPTGVIAMPGGFDIEPNSGDTVANVTVGQIIVTTAGTAGFALVGAYGKQISNVTVESVTLKKLAGVKTSACDLPIFGVTNVRVGNIWHSTDAANTNQAMVVDNADGVTLTVDIPRTGTPPPAIGATSAVTRLDLRGRIGQSASHCLHVYALSNAVIDMTLKNPANGSMVVSKNSMGASDRVILRGDWSKASTGSWAMNVAGTVTNWLLDGTDLTGWGADLRVKGAGTPTAVDRRNVKGLTYGTAKPNFDAWGVGHVVENTAPAELGTTGSKYVVTGWRCVAAGSPGTWVEQRALTGQ